MDSTSVYVAFQPLFYLSKVLGTMPLQLKFKPHGRLRKDWPAVVYSAILAVITVVHGISTPYFASVETKTSSTSLVAVDISPNVSDYVKFIHNQTTVQLVAMKMVNPLIAAFMTLGVQIISLTLICKDLPKFFSELYETDFILNSVVVHDSRIDWRVTRVLIAYFLVLSLPVNLLYLVFSPEFWSFVRNFWLTVNNMISFASEVQFICLAFYLRLRFKEINDFIKKQKAPNVSSNFFSVYKNFLPFKRTLTLRRTELLHISNKKLCGLMKELNKIYQFQLLCSISGCFLKILFNVYFGLFGKMTTSLSNDNHLSKLMAWSIFYFIRFLITTVVASSTSKEASKTKSIVAQVISRDLSPDIKEELHMFLNHTTNWTMTFTACGLFTINTKLITSALAAGTTYLVILVQFRPQI